MGDPETTAKTLSLDALAEIPSEERGEVALQAAMLEARDRALSLGGRLLAAIGTLPADSALRRSELTDRLSTFLASQGNDPEVRDRTMRSLFALEGEEATRAELARPKLSPLVAGFIDANCAQEGYRGDLLRAEGDRLRMRLDGRPPISVRLKGGLGNQMLQYAAGRAASLRLHCPLVLDTSPLPLLEAEGSTPRSFMLDVFNIKGQVSGSGEGDWTDYHQPSDGYDPAFEQIAPGARLNGYFSSEAFFKPYEDRIREDFTLLVEVSYAFTSLLGQIQREPCPVAVHIRRGDYQTLPAARTFHGLIGPPYYEKACRIVDALAEAPPTYFVFSDDRQAAEEIFAGRKKVIVDTPVERPWEDMMLMGTCRHTVMANSSFSWWGAWLARAPGQLIVAPRQWMTQETLRKSNTADLYLPESIII